MKLRHAIYRWLLIRSGRAGNRMFWFWNFFLERLESWEPPEIRAMGEFIHIVASSMDRDFDDPYDSPEYQQFVAKVAETCEADDKPCDSCLAGGVCDGPEPDWLRDMRECLYDDDDE